MRLAHRRPPRCCRRPPAFRDRRRPAGSGKRIVQPSPQPASTRVGPGQRSACLSEGRWPGGRHGPPGRVSVACCSAARRAGLCGRSSPAGCRPAGRAAAWAAGHPTGDSEKRMGPLSGRAGGRPRCAPAGLQGDAPRPRPPSAAAARPPGLSVQPALRGICRAPTAASCCCPEGHHDPDLTRIRVGRGPVRQRRRPAAAVSANGCGRARGCGRAPLRGPAGAVSVSDLPPHTPIPHGECGAR